MIRRYFLIVPYNYRIRWKKIAYDSSMTIEENMTPSCQTCGFFSSLFRIQQYRLLFRIQQDRPRHFASMPLIAAHPARDWRLQVEVELVMALLNNLNFFEDKLNTKTLFSAYFPVMLMHVAAYINTRIHVYTYVHAQRHTHTHSLHPYLYLWPHLHLCLYLHLQA